MNKKYFLIIALILTLFSAFGEVAFNSYAGASMDLSAKDNDKIKHENVGELTLMVDSLFAFCIWCEFVL